MKLSDYLELDGNRASSLAAECKVAVSTITRAAKGELVPSRSLMEALFRQTGGRVTPNDFFELSVEPEAAPASEDREAA